MRVKESNEDIYYDKELVKLACLDCEQVLYSKGTFNMIKTEGRRKGSCVTEFYLSFDFPLELLS